MMGDLRKHIAEAMLLALEGHPGKRVLLCGADALMYSMARKKLPGMAIECLRGSRVYDFARKIEVPEAESYDYILDMRLVEESSWDTRLLRAMGNKTVTKNLNKSV